MPPIFGGALPRRRHSCVLFDRDGTLVHDVPYNGDPARVRPIDGARAAVQLVRTSGLRTGVVTNQSAIAKGLITEAQAVSVNRRIDGLLGPFDVWALCPHDDRDGCRCRKPRPGLIDEACRALDVEPRATVVIGDIASDMDAANAAGAMAVMVPNERTLLSELRAADAVFRSLGEAVEAILKAAR